MSYNKALYAACLLLHIFWCTGGSSVKASEDFFAEKTFSPEDLTVQHLLLMNAVGYKNQVLAGAVTVFETLAPPLAGLCAGVGITVTFLYLVCTFLRICSKMKEQRRTRMQFRALRSPPVGYFFSQGRKYWREDINANIQLCTPVEVTCDCNGEHTTRYTMQCLPDTGPEALINPGLKLVPDVLPKYCFYVAHPKDCNPLCVGFRFGDVACIPYHGTVGNSTVIAKVLTQGILLRPEACITLSGAYNTEEMSAGDFAFYKLSPAQWATLGVASVSVRMFQRSGTGNVTVYGTDPAGGISSGYGVLTKHDDPEVAKTFGLVTHTANTLAGFSGCPLFGTHNGAPCIRGIHTGSAKTGLGEDVIYTNFAVSVPAFKAVMQDLGLWPEKSIQDKVFDLLQITTFELKPESGGKAEDQPDFEINGYKSRKVKKLERQLARWVSDSCSIHGDDTHYELNCKIRACRDQITACENSWIKIHPDAASMPNLWAECLPISIPSKGPMQTVEIAEVPVPQGPQPPSMREILQSRMRSSARTFARSSIETLRSATLSTEKLLTQALEHVPADTESSCSDSSCGTHIASENGTAWAENITADDCEVVCQITNRFVGLPIPSLVPTAPPAPAWFSHSCNSSRVCTESESPGVSEITPPPPPPLPHGLACLKPEALHSVMAESNLAWREQCGDLDDVVVLETGTAARGAPSVKCYPQSHLASSIGDVPKAPVLKRTRGFKRCEVAERYWKRNNRDTPPAVNRAPDQRDATPEEAKQCLVDLFGTRTSRALNNATGYTYSSLRYSQSFLPFCQYLDACLADTSTDATTFKAKVIPDANGNEFFKKFGSVLKGGGKPGGKSAKPLAVAPTHPDIIRAFRLKYNYTAVFTMPPSGQSDILDSMTAQAKEVSPGYVDFDPATLDVVEDIIEAYPRGGETLLEKGMPGVTTFLDNLQDKSSGWSKRWVNLTKKELVLKHGGALGVIAMCRILLRASVLHLLPTMSPAEMYILGLADPKQIVVKDEPHPERKSKSLKWRLIWVASTVDSVCQGLVHHTQNKCEIEAYQSGRFSLSAIGLGHDDHGVELFCNYLFHHHGDGPISSSDASAWDLSVNRDVLVADTKVRIALSTGAADIALWSECWCNSAHILWNGTELFECCSYGLTASGVPSTSPQNSRARSFLCLLAGGTDPMSVGDDLTHGGTMDKDVLLRAGVRTKLGSETVSNLDGGVDSTSHLYLRRADGTFIAMYENFEKMLANLENKRSLDCQIVGACAGVVRNTMVVDRLFADLCKELGYSEDSLLAYKYGADVADMF